MRKIAWLAAVVTLLATGSYVFVYLYRWEWHRALLVGVLFLAAEIAVGIALVLRRLPSRDRAGEDAGGGQEPRPQAGTTNRPLERPEFAWLRGDGGFGVFIPVLLGSGVIVTAVAWIVERLAARGTPGAAADTLSQRLAPLAFPETLLVEHPEVDPVPGGSGSDVDLLVRPHAGRR